MKTITALGLALVLTLGRQAAAQVNVARDAASTVARSPLIGAWRLVWLDGPGPDGKMQRITDAKGSLIYTPTGVVSVQVMYPSATVSNAYATGGYEASFGRYIVNEAAHTVTHRYEASLVRSHIAEDLARRYELTGERLIIRPIRPEERWSVMWERVPEARKH